MTEVDLVEQDLLEAARRGLSPESADAERVLRATHAAIAGAAAAGVPAAPASSAHADASVRTSLGNGTAPALRGGASWWTLAWCALSIAVLSGAGGYYLGRHATPAAVRDASDDGTAPAPRGGASFVASALHPPAPPHAPITTAPAPILPAPVAATAVPAPSFSDTAAALRGGASVHRGASDPLPRVAARRGAALTEEAAPAETIASSTQEEITAMRRVERALREHEAQRALTLLFELDRNVPNGKLMQERQAAFAMARCAAGLGSPSQLVADFAAHYRNSAYLARVRQMCAREATDSAAPGD